jgi:hypothetical protein
MSKASSSQATKDIESDQRQYIIGPETAAHLLTGEPKKGFPVGSDFGALALNQAKVNQEATSRYTKTTAAIAKNSHKGGVIADAIAAALKNKLPEPQAYADILKGYIDQCSKGDVTTIVLANDAFADKFAAILAATASNLALVAAAGKLLTDPATILHQPEQRLLAKCAYPLGKFVTAAENVDAQGNFKVKDELVDDLRRHLRHIHEARGYFTHLRSLFFKGKDALHKTQLLVTKEQAEYKSQEDDRTKRARELEFDRLQADAKRYKAERDELRDKLSEERCARAKILSLLQSAGASALTPTASPVRG